MSQFYVNVNNPNTLWTTTSASSTTINWSPPTYDLPPKPRKKAKPGPESPLAWLDRRVDEIRAEFRDAA